MKTHYYVLAAVAAVIGQRASAQTADTSGDQLQEVVVTAEKRTERLQDVPIAITVVGSQQLQDQHINSIADLAQSAPSLEMIQTFGGPGGGGQIRGIGTQSFTRSAEGSVGVVVDGISQGNLNVSDIFDIQHIEVLEGPQGTLFGLTSSAGVISMTTNAPDPSKFETIWHVDYAHHGTAGSEFGQQTIHGVVNVPLTGASALRVAASLDDNEGVQHNSYTGTDDKAQNYAVRARYLLKATDALTVNVIADAQRTQQHGAEGGTIASFTYVTADPILTQQLAACGITAGYGNQDRCANHPQLAYDTNYGLSGQLDYDFGPATLTSISAYRRDESGPDAQDVMALPSAFPQIWSYGALTAASEFSEELRIASNPGTKLDYTAGLYYLNYITLGYYEPGAFFHVLLPIPPVPIENGGPETTFTQTSNKSAAAFGQATYHVTDQFGVIAGLRYTYQTITDYASPLGSQPGASGNTGSTSLQVVEHNVSGKLGVQFKVNDQLATYATATKGYKGPQAQAASPTSPAILVAAEIPLAFEIGLKAQTADNRLSADIAAFNTKDHNYQGQSCALTPIGVLACNPNSVDVTTRGVEINLNARPVNNWTVTAGYIYDNATYPAGYQGENPNVLIGPGNSLPLGGEQVIGVPKNKFTFSTDYIVPFGAVNGFIGTDVVYKSAIRLGPSPLAEFSYPPHWTVGARLGVRSQDGRWGVTLFGRDINNNHEPLTLFAGPGFYPPGVNPTAPAGAVQGISGWVGQQSLREVGVSFDLKL